MAVRKLRSNGAFHVVAKKLAEAAAEYSHDDIRRALGDCLNDYQRSSGVYCWLTDVFGDENEGYVVYSCGNDLYRAPYELKTVAGKRATMIDFDQAEDVLPHTTYEPEADDDDLMSAAEAASMLVVLGSMDEPLIERFVSKAERDGASSGSFAGKGKSFPILKPGDVAAAVRSLGRAGSSNYSVEVLKKNIKRIAKAKGWGKYLPASWKADSDSTEGAPAVPAADADGQRDCVENAALYGEVKLLEAERTEYPVKLISPGWGSSGYYSKEVLKRDGPKLFKAGTHMYWNHPTNAEEADRPEGDLNNLAAVLTSPAKFDENGSDGPGLYAKAKVFSDYAKQVEEKAPHIGLSIRARGKAKEGEAEGRRGWLITELNHAESADFVTKPGRDGKILQESALPAGKEGDVDKNEVVALINEATAPVISENKKLKERLAFFDARSVVDAYFGTVRVSEGIRARVTKRVLEGVMPLTAEGLLDKAKLTEAVAAETKDEAEFIARETGAGRPVGLGVAAPLETDPVKAREAHDKEFSASMDGLADIFGVDKKGFREGRAA